MNLVIIFAKTPVAGRVKTRLARDVGDEKALQVYEQVLHGLVNRLNNKSFDLCMYVSGNPHYFYSHFDDVRIEPQIGDDLGRKLFHAFQAEMPNYERIIVIGSDCPDISTEFIESCFAGLQKHDCVIGPASDGGYYLIGLSKLSDIFVNVDWSTEKVFSQTMNLVKEKKLSAETLAVKSDIDTAKDYEFYKERGLVQ